ncbi:hypothetical protein VP01_2528g2 [Puccinia sorghi]|uniref:Uncharacterized protein n=1 Tax=Puccinia sorghi TaxID=27349 RepID=A0A0L6V5I6_9BASI|nr:hypothetical protein VP01_2528g2 [Puccinia sorghi]
MAPPAVSNRDADRTQTPDVTYHLVIIDWPWCMNSKRDEDYELLPRYLKAVILFFRLIKTFLSWKEVISRLDGWNPYQEITMAKTLAKMAKEKQEAETPKGATSQLNYTQAKTPPAENPTFMKEHLCRYKIPKRPALQQKHCSASTSTEQQQEKEEKQIKISKLQQKQNSQPTKSKESQSCPSADGNG